VTLSHHIRIVLLAVLSLAAVGAGMVALHARRQATTAPTPVVAPARPAPARPATTVAQPAVQAPATGAPAAVEHRTPAPVATPAPAPAPTAPSRSHGLALDPTLPPPVRQALEHSNEVVAFVYSPSSPTDLLALKQVREGAREAHVPLVLLNVGRNSLAAAVFRWTSSAVDPEVLVVRRPGKVAFTLPGMTDSTPVAQAATSAR